MSIFPSAKDLFLKKVEKRVPLDVVVCRISPAIAPVLSVRALQWLWDKSSPLVELERIDFAAYAARSPWTLEHNCLGPNPSSEPGLLVTDQGVVTLKLWHSMPELFEYTNPLLAFRSHPDLLQAVREFESNTDLAIVTLEIPTGLGPENVRIYCEPGFEETIFVGLEYSGHYAGAALEKK